MDAAGWNQRYDTTELVWTAEPSQFLVAETSSLAPGAARTVDPADRERAVVDALVRARRPGQR